MAPDMCSISPTKDSRLLHRTSGTLVPNESSHLANWWWKASSYCSPSCSAITAHRHLLAHRWVLRNIDLEKRLSRPPKNWWLKVDFLLKIDVAVKTWPRWFAVTWVYAFMAKRLPRLNPKRNCCTFTPRNQEDVKNSGTMQAAPASRQQGISKRVS